MTIRKQQAKAAKRYKIEPTKQNLNRLHKLNMMLLKQNDPSRDLLF